MSDSIRYNGAADKGINVRKHLKNKKKEIKKRREFKKNRSELRSNTFSRSY